MGSFKTLNFGLNCKHNNIFSNAIFFWVGSLKQKVYFFHAEKPYLTIMLIFDLHCLFAHVCLMCASFSLIYVIITRNIKRSVFELLGCTTSSIKIIPMDQPEHAIFWFYKTTIKTRGQVGFTWGIITYLSSLTKKNMFRILAGNCRELSES